MRRESFIYLGKEEEEEEDPLAGLDVDGAFACVAYENKMEKYAGTREREKERGSSFFFDDDARSRSNTHHHHQH